MKLARLWLVVLLAVLLPLRGALAVAMPCASAGGTGHGELRAAGHHTLHGQGHGTHAGEQAPHDHGHGHGHGHDPDTPKCDLCSASCSVPPLPSTSTGLREPVVLASVSFPRLSAPAATFQSDGPERPPRTL